MRKQNVGCWREWGWWVSKLLFGSHSGVCQFGKSNGGFRCQFGTVCGGAIQSKSKVPKYLIWFFFKYIILLIVLSLDTWFLLWLCGIVYTQTQSVCLACLQMSKLRPNGGLCGFCLDFGEINIPFLSRCGIWNPAFSPLVFYFVIL